MGCADRLSEEAQHKIAGAIIGRQHLMPDTGGAGGMETRAPCSSFPSVAFRLAPERSSRDVLRTHSPELSTL
jgi:hypothetical protein